MTPARRRGAKKKIAILPRCPLVHDGLHFNRTLLASSKGAPLAHLVCINAIKVKALSLAAWAAQKLFYISLPISRATLPRVKQDVAIRVTTLR